MSALRSRIKSLPFIGVALSSLRRSRFPGSAPYWQLRYIEGGTSGAGSYGRLAQMKAEFLNELVRREGIMSVLELGTGDGAQLELADYPSYVGVDVAPFVIAKCRERFADDLTKRFLVTGDGFLPTCELGLSLDVIYHLVEDSVFEQYMDDLLEHSTRFVVLYTSDSDVFVPEEHHPGPPHIRHRPVMRWMTTQSQWTLKERLANLYPFDPADQTNSSFADFYLYERI